MRERISFSLIEHDWDLDSFLLFYLNFIILIIKRNQFFTIFEIVIL